MTRGGTKPDLGKAILVALSHSGWTTARQVNREAQVHLWNLDLSMSATVARLELFITQGLVEKRRNENGATQYRLKVDMEFC